MFTLSQVRNEKGKEMRMAIVETLQDLMKTDDKIVAFEADLGAASGFTKIAKSNPEQFVQCGIAEANMTGAAAGMSLLGFKPFIHSFAPFVSRRVYDQLYLSGGYAKTTVNVYGSDPGFCAAHNGGTHTTFEDIALMRLIPDSVVVDPCDAVEMEWTIREFAKMEGVHYVRANRKPVRKVYEEGSTFELGKGNVVKTGNDALIIACGELVTEALDAAESLEKEGIHTEVIDMFCIKPLDSDLLLKEIPGKKAVVTLENHSIIGGLGSAVDDVMTENKISVPYRKMGIREQFGQVGLIDYLKKEFGLTSADVERTVKEVLGE